MNPLQFLQTTSILTDQLLLLDPFRNCQKNKKCTKLHLYSIYAWMDDVIEYRFQLPSSSAVSFGFDPMRLTTKELRPLQQSYRNFIKIFTEKIDFIFSQLIGVEEHEEWELFEHDDSPSQQEEAAKKVIAVGDFVLHVFRFVGKWIPGWFQCCFLSIADIFDDERLVDFVALSLLPRSAGKCCGCSSSRSEEESIRQALVEATTRCAFISSRIRDDEERRHALSLQEDNDDSLFFSSDHNGSTSESSNQQGKSREIREYDDIFSRLTKENSKFPVRVHFASLAITEGILAEIVTRYSAQESHLRKQEGFDAWVRGERVRHVIQLVQSIRSP